MLSVDNFYYVFQSYYKWKNTKVLAWRFPNGSRDLLNLDHCDPDDDIYKLGKSHFGMYGTMILHDQEPFTLEYAKQNILTYRSTIEPYKNTTFEEQGGFEFFFMTRFFSASSPIWCHSQESSTDIKWLEELGFISAYYFWHGLVARDWFRHWRHHADLRKFNINIKPYRFLLYARDHTGMREYRRQVIESLSDIKHDILYNWSGENQVPASHSAVIVEKDALDSHIHIVAETVFDRNMIHVTEKIFKPMVMMQPFIVFAGQGTLAYLRRYGFKTFGDIWDESYDLETNHQTRLNKVSKLIHDISALSDAELQLLLSKCREVVEHNRNHFFSDEFEKIMLDEMHINVSNAIQEQRTRMESDPGGLLLKGVDLSMKHKYVHNQGNWNSVRKMLDEILLQDPGRYERIARDYPWIKDHCLVLS